MWGAVVFPCATTIAAVSLRRKGTSNCNVLVSSNIPSNSRSSSPLDFPLASRIIVRNLPFTTTETSIQKHFSNFGQVAEGAGAAPAYVLVKLVKDEDGKKSKGYAFVQYTSQDDAMLALENMDQKLIDGRVVHVELAKMVNYAFGAYPRTSGPPK